MVTFRFLLVALPAFGLSRPVTAQFAVAGGWDVVASNVKEVGEVLMGGNEAVKRQR
jgi:hypothetical protein